MGSEAIKQYETYWLKKPIYGGGASKQSLISTDSQVVVLAIEGDKALVCRFGNYIDSAYTSIDNLSRWQHKS